MMPLISTPLGLQVLHIQDQGVRFPLLIPKHQIWYVPLSDYPVQLKIMGQCSVKSWEMDSLDQEVITKLGASHLGCTYILRAARRVARVPGGSSSLSRLLRALNSLPSQILMIIFCDTTFKGSEDITNLSKKQRWTSLLSAILKT